MGLIFDDEIDRIDLPDGEWVDIKRQFSQGDLVTVAASAFRGATRNVTTGEATDVSLEQQILTARFTGLEVAIRAWSFTHDGEPVPVTPENIRRLSIPDYTIVYGEIEKRNRRFTAEERKE